MDNLTAWFKREERLARVRVRANPVTSSVYSFDCDVHRRVCWSSDCPFHESTVDSRGYVHDSAGRNTGIQVGPPLVESDDGTPRDPDGMVVPGCWD